MSRERERELYYTLTSSVRMHSCVTCCWSGSCSYIVLPCKRFLVERFILKSTLYLYKSHRRNVTATERKPETVQGNGSFRVPRINFIHFSTRVQSSRRERAFRRVSYWWLKNMIYLYSILELHVIIILETWGKHENKKYKFAMFKTYSFKNLCFILIYLS